MNQTILQTLFLDNPQIPEKIAQFCKSSPECVRAEQEYNQAARELMALIGYERYSCFEEALTNYLFYEARAHYLFGLGLRRDLLSGLVQ